LNEEALIEVAALDDCIANVLLLEYARLHKLIKVEKAITQRARELLKAEDRDKDKHWLLIYQIWSEAELRGNKQSFLADLKSKGFRFLAPSNIQAKEVTTNATVEMASTEAAIVPNEVRAVA
jgi:hypothetical protein